MADISATTAVAIGYGAVSLRATRRGTGDLGAPISFSPGACDRGPVAPECAPGRYRGALLALK